MNACRSVYLRRRMKREGTMTAFFEELGQIWQWVWDNIFYINIILAFVIVFFQRRDPKAVWT